MENVIEYLETKWQKLTSFSRNEEVKSACWGEIVEQYGRRNRHYHNLTHLGNLFHLFDSYVAGAKNAACIGFAIFYHDLVYDTLRNDNEEQSAGKASEHLQLLKCKPTFINEVVALVLATKNHTVEEGPFKEDMALFLDLDLAVLAEDWKDYEFYRKSIRKEFNQYNDGLFIAGRKNALEQILKKDSIFYTQHFKQSLETKARQNLEREIELLGNTL